MKQRNSERSCTPTTPEPPKTPADLQNAVGKHRQGTENAKTWNNTTHGQNRRLQIRQSKTTTLTGNHNTPAAMLQPNNQKTRRPRQIRHHHTENDGKGPTPRPAQKEEKKRDTKGKKEKFKATRETSLRGDAEWDLIAPPSILKE
jgi:hypothetical protein